MELPLLIMWQILIFFTRRNFGSQCKQFWWCILCTSIFWALCTILANRCERVRLSCSHFYVESINYISWHWMVAVTDFDYIVFTVVFHWKSRKTVVVTFMCTFSFFCIWALIILVWEGNSNFISWSRYGLDRWESVPLEKWQGCMSKVLKTNSFQVPECHLEGVCPIHFHPSEWPKSVEFK